MNAEITQLIDRYATGDVKAGNELFECLYGELRDVAARFMNKERSDHSLQPTTLVNEAALRLLAGDVLKKGKNRAYFFAAASRAMRSILVDHARKRAAAKRPTGEGRNRVALDETLDFVETTQQVDLLDLDAALEKLHQLNSRHHEVVMLRFFGGLELGEVATHLGVSLSTVEKDWRFARTWLRGQMKNS